MSNILVVDDEREIADVVELYLKDSGFDVCKCYSAKQALECIANQDIDLAILDVMLPGTNGFAILEKIRESYHYPVIMLTAKHAESDKIAGLSIGADDYITKPFRPLELVARVKAQLRRYTKYNAQPKDQNVIEIGDLLINRNTHECTLDEETLNLTPTEFALLWSLCENRGEVLSGERIFNEVWKGQYYSNDSNTIMVHIRHLREKMKDSADNPKYIKTVWGVGYKIE